MVSTAHSPIDLYVINAVRERRIEKGYSQKELAYLLEVSIAYIGNVESPKHRAKYNLSHLNDLAVIFNCSPKDFLPTKPIEDKKWKRQQKEAPSKGSIKAKPEPIKTKKPANKKIKPQTSKS